MHDQSTAGQLAALAQGASHDQDLVCTGLLLLVIHVAGRVRVLPPLQ